jgi:TRAP-type C4-dicarboxylate transport system permease small subunit
MRARTVLIILLVPIMLIAFGPAIIAVGSQEIAEAFGCQVDLNRAIPCVIHGKDYGDTFYNLGFAIWYSYLSLPVGGVLFVIWLVPATIVMLASLRRRGT